MSHNNLTFYWRVPLHFARMLHLLLSADLHEVREKKRITRWDIGIVDCVWSCFNHVSVTATMSRFFDVTYSVKGVVVALFKKNWREKVKLVFRPHHLLLYTLCFTYWEIYLLPSKHNPANTKHSYNICTTSAQRLRRWSNIVQMLYKSFVFAGQAFV